MANQQNAMGNSGFNPVLEELRQAFFAYDLMRARDGSVVVTVKNTGERVTDPQIISKVDYAHIWFDEITAGASWGGVGNRKEDERLTGIAFGNCGIEAFQGIQNSFMNAFEQAEQDGGANFSNTVATNLQNMQLTSSYGGDIKRVLLAGPDVILNRGCYRPDYFRAKTAEFMSDIYLEQNSSKGLLDKAKDVLGKIKD